MQKEETQQLKGIAILMMLWAHLFTDIDMLRQCHWLLPFFGDKPLAYALIRICSCCVPIYILLGGYGMASVYRQQQGKPMHNGRRALSLMVNFWVVFLLFIPLGCIVNPQQYPGSLLVLLLNIAGIDYSYNGAWWFLLPYVLLTLCAAPFIRCLMQNTRRTDLLSLVLLLVTFVAGYLGKDIPIADGTPLRIVYTASSFVYMLLPFAVGILFVKYGVMELLRRRLSTCPTSLLLLLLAALCLVKMLLGGSALLNLPFILLVLPLLLALPKPGWLRTTLQYFGHHSTNMWLTHCFFIYNIFGTLIYRLSYPLLIFAVLIVVSLLSSYIVQLLFEPLRRRIRKA